ADREVAAFAHPSEHLEAVAFPVDDEPGHRLRRLGGERLLRRLERVAPVERLALGQLAALRAATAPAWNPRPPLLIQDSDWNAVGMRIPADPTTYSAGTRPPVPEHPTRIGAKRRAPFRDRSEATCSILRSCHPTAERDQVIRWKS